MYEGIKKLFVIGACVISLSSSGQTVSKRLLDAFQKFENDSQLSNAISSFYVINAKTGEVVFDKNSRTGLAPASTLKVITAATAYELLGRNFKYETKFGYIGTIKNKSLLGDFYVKPSGDPTLGSWRWRTTSDTSVITKMSSAIKKIDISGFNDITIDDRGWNSEVIPDGWIWQDIGNYYGAGAAGFNWRENQFDIIMRSGKNIGDPVTIVKTVPRSPVPLTSMVKSAAKGTGDNSYVYYPLTDVTATVRGTIPVDETSFTISASNPIPENSFTSLLMENLTKSGTRQIHYEAHSPDTTILLTHYSPPLDSIVYWFLKKSINLYGEALVKTFAYQKNRLGETDKGVQLVKNFWKEKGIASTELNMVDGSGLSPLNRITTHAQVMVLKYAKAQAWFDGYYNAFPEYNGMKMKSGTINGVKGFCGYQKSENGNEYIFSFLVNNYNGSPSAVVEKMYKVLDALK